MKTFTAQKFNESAVSKRDYVLKFAKLGFVISESDVTISFTNGCSAYISMAVNVINEGKMPADAFVMDGISYFKVRVSDHSSNLERICGGFCSNTMSFSLFMDLVSSNVIKS